MAMKLPRIPYTYLLRCKSTNQVYYGAQYGLNVNPLNLWVSYYSSSGLVKKLLAIHGKEDFEFEVRKTFECPIKCREWEHKVLRRLHVSKKKVWLNQTENPGRPLRCQPHSPETKAKMSIAQKNNPRGRTGKTIYPAARIAVKARNDGEENPFKDPKFIRDNADRKIGKVFVTNGEINKMILKLELETYLSSGWRKGQTWKNGRTSYGKPNKLNA